MTIINKTVVINDTHISNNITVNSGPRVANIEKATGRSIRQVPVRQMRAAEEARSGVKAKIGTPSAASQGHAIERPQGALAVAQPPRAVAPERSANRVPDASAAAVARMKADSDAKTRADANSQALAAEKAKAARALSQENTEEKAKPAEGRPEATRSGVAPTDVKATAEAKAKAEAKARADAEAKAAAAKAEEERPAGESKPQQ